MLIKDVKKLLKDEKSACRYLKKLLWKNYHKFCIRCRCFRVYTLRDGRYRCGRCKYTFNDFTGRWISKVNVKYDDWIWAVKLFSLGISTRKISEETGISYPAALKAVGIIRRSIVVHNKEYTASGNVELDEAYFGGRRKGNRGRGAGGKVPVFGILERNGKVSVSIVPNVSAETLLSLTVKKVKRGSIVYTDKWKSYDSLMFCGYRHLKLDHDKRFSRGKVHINGMEGFWSYAKERLAKHHGVSPKKFPLYIKEQEFRYNNRDKDIFEILLNYVTDLVPNRL
jgi:transposase